METIAVAVAAVAALFGIAVLGWSIALKTKKRNGALENENAALLGDIEARKAQDRAFDRAHGRDLASDRDFLPNPAD